MCTCGKGGTTRRGLLTGLATLAAFAHLPPVRAQVPAGGSLRQAKGSVTINGKPARAGASVASGDVVTAGTDSEAVFTLGDDGFLLRAEGAVRVLGDGRSRQVELEQGRLLSVFGPKEIALKTPQASVGIRGTACYLEARPKVTNICVCYGHAVMTPDAAPAQAREVRTRHHDAPHRIFGPGHDPVIEPYSAVNHADEELVMLEALVGRVPAFMGK